MSKIYWEESEKTFPCRRTTFCSFPEAPARRRPCARSKLPYKRARVWPSGACRKYRTEVREMEAPEFPIEKTNQGQAEITPKTEQRHALRKYVPTEQGTIPAQNYDSLLDYWHILFRHRVTLLTITLATLCLALFISVVQTPIYR